MPEYSKMKNADLEALLRERGLPHTGKKADMVERLQKNDEESAAAPAESKPAGGAEDEIDWDDDADETATAPAAAATTVEAVITNEETTASAGGEGRSPNPQAAPDQVADIDPAKADDLSVQPPVDGEAGDEATKEKNEPAPDYSIGLAATNLDEEIEKRRKRALKFGTNPDDDEGLKKLERAKKFGEVGPPKGLDEALPERQRKRGREDNDDAGGHKRRGGGHPGGRGRGGRDRRDNRDSRDRDTRDTRRGENKSNGRAGSWMSEKDRAAAEARRAKWSKPAA
ncbi:hypothetical protein ACN47E_000325 [Coniothyrium glycines]